MRKLLLVFFFAAGCTAPADAPSPECALDVDCGFGAICLGGACVVGCIENGDCGLDAPCIEGRCDDTAGACNADAYCDFGERCDLDRQRCVPTMGADNCDACALRFCRDSSDCSGAPCEPRGEGLLGVCQPCGEGSSCRYAHEVTERCSDDDDCGAGGSCYRPSCFEQAHCEGEVDFGTCTARAYSSGSLSDAGTCSQGICEYSSCVAEGCSNDDDCGRGFACFIEIGEMPSCDVDTDCAGERFCRRLNEASDVKVCACLDDGDCPDGTCVGQLCSVNRYCETTPGLTCQDV